ncbi:MAG: HD domain-containing protein [Deltaproteobacteria bacterium]|nr:HD domain-containing protein [Deltaproteobacteria bacterium]
MKLEQGQLASQASILVVEGEKREGRRLKELLEKQHFAVHSETNGKAALEFALEDPPDMIITGIGLAGMDGFALCDAAKKSEPLKDVPVILLTSMGDVEEILRALKVNADACVTRPYNPYFLLSKIKNLLENPVKRSGKHPDGVKVMYKNRRHIIHTPPETMVSLLLSTYEDAVLRNYEMTRTQEALEEITGKLEEKVADRTAALEKEVAERTATARDLTRVVRRLKRAMEEIIHAMVATLKIRDPYTADHQSRVAWLAVAMAQEMGLSDSRIEGIRMACMIHDIGKIAVPLDILNKPGRLSPIEFALIKTHPEVGYNILRSVEFPWPIADMVLQHHERLDGSGYPSNLSGNSILQESKIIAVADVVEAMASHRPYRPSLGIDIALEEVRHKRKVSFDPDAVDACISLFKKKGFSFE